MVQLDQQVQPQRIEFSQALALELHLQPGAPQLLVLQAHQQLQGGHGAFALEWVPEQHLQEPEHVVEANQFLQEFEADLAKPQ